MLVVWNSVTSLLIQLENKVKIEGFNDYNNQFVFNFILVSIIETELTFLTNE